jgi:hypothetical protein
MKSHSGFDLRKCPICGSMIDKKRMECLRCHWKVTQQEGLKAEFPKYMDNGSLFRITIHNEQEYLSAISRGFEICQELK